MFTPEEQHKMNNAYAYMKSALDELALILNKDSVLIKTQRTMYSIEDTLHQYVGPVKGVKK